MSQIKVMQNLKFTACLKQPKFDFRSFMLTVTSSAARFQCPLLAMFKYVEVAVEEES